MEVWIAGRQQPSRHLRPVREHVTVSCLRCYVELKEDIADADVPHDGLTIRSLPESFQYFGGFGFRPRLDGMEKLIEDVV